MLCSVVQKGNSSTITIGSSSGLTNCASNSKAVQYLNLLKSLNPNNPTDSPLTVTPADYRNFLKFLRTRDFRLMSSEQENSLTLNIISELVKLRPINALNFLDKQIAQNAKIIDQSQTCKRKISSLLLQLDELTEHRYSPRITESLCKYLSKLNIATKSYLEDLIPVLDFVADHANEGQLLRLTSISSRFAKKGYRSGDLHLRYILSKVANSCRSHWFSDLIQDAHKNTQIFNFKQVELSIPPVRLALCYLSCFAMFKIANAFVHPMFSVTASIIALFTTMKLLTKENVSENKNPAIKNFNEFIDSLIQKTRD